MLLRISENQIIDPSEIYLVDKDSDGELMIFIRPHAKVPVILKGQDNIDYFMWNMRKYTNEHQATNTEDDPSTSQNPMEQPDAVGAPEVQRHDEAYARG